MLNRLIEPDSGAISINGKSIHQQPIEKLRRGIGYVLQNTSLFPHYTVAENIGVVPNLLGFLPGQIRKRTAELMEKLHLTPDLANAFPSQLSGGQQQRAGLARALAANPPVLLMDEPFGALDNVTRAKIHTEFLELDELKLKTIVMVTHDVREAFELGDRICLMHEGRIVQEGKPADLLFKPANDFVRTFFDNQRRQLELTTLTISDLEKLLPEKFAAVHSLKKKSSVSDSLELLKAPEDISILLTAFYTFKQTLSHE